MTFAAACDSLREDPRMVASRPSWHINEFVYSGVILAWADRLYKFMPAHGSSPWAPHPDEAEATDWVIERNTVIW